MGNAILANRFLPLIEETDEDSDLWNELCAEVMRPQNEFLTINNKKDEKINNTRSNTVAKKTGRNPKEKRKCVFQYEIQS